MLPGNKANLTGQAETPLIGFLMFCKSAKVVIVSDAWKAYDLFENANKSHNSRN